MEPVRHPEAVLDDLQKLRARARRDRRSTSVPLLTFGVLTLLAVAMPDAAVYGVAGSFYWVVAGPVGFGFLAWWYQRHEARSGVGSRARPYLVIAVVLAVAFLLFMGLALLFGGALAAIALGLLGIAAAHRNALLGAAAVVFGTVGVAEWFGAVSNVASSVMPGQVHVDGRAVFVVLGAMLVAAGLLAWVSEDKA